MSNNAWLIFLSSSYPLVCAWRANRQTSLTHALAWTSAAWLCWGLVLASNDNAMRYLALCLTGCAEVAVLGARRPGVAAWNFVVAGLLLVLLGPLAEEALIGTPLQLGGVRTLFLAGTLAVGTLNYLPTRLAPAALLLGTACVLEVYSLLTGDASARPCVDLTVVLVPWAAWLVTRSHPQQSAFDRLWLEYRDRFGFVWGQRLRDQFNRSAHHAGWPVDLTWFGLRSSLPLDDATMTACRTTLLALMKRFGTAEE